MGVGITVIVVVLLSAGPLIVAAASGLVVGAVVGLEWEFLQLAVTLLLLQLLAALSVVSLYRWCFGRAPVRGAGLLAACIVSVLLLSSGPFLSLLDQVISASLEGAQFAKFFAAVVIDGLTLVGFACVSCMLTILLVELPIRWVQGEWQVISEGTFRAARALLVLIIFVVSSALLRDRGVSHVIDLISRALA
jgi:hypothetical protein